MHLPDDTIVAPATLPGTGAIGIIRLSGPQAFEVLDKVVKFNHDNINDFKGYTIHKGLVSFEDGSPLDDVLVSVFRSPHSYTGEDSVEIGFHASVYIASELVRLLTAAGARTAAPGEFTQRAYLNGKMDLAQAEAVADVISSKSSASHRLAVKQLRGGISNELLQMRAGLLEMLSLIELELDFSEEEVEFADRNRLAALLDSVLLHISRLADSFRLGNAIRSGIPVAIVGAPNTGKSSLLNALLGDDRAIVSGIAGTTRDTVEECMDVGGILFRFIDTAGIHEATEPIESMGVNRSIAKLTKADIVLLVTDATDSSEAAANEAKKIVDMCNPEQQFLIVLENKIDLLRPSDVGNNIVVLLNKDVVHIEKQAVSAKTGKGVDKLLERIADYGKKVESGNDTVLITNARHHEALLNAREYLQAARKGLDTTLPTDIVAQDLHDAIDCLSSITGMSIPEDEVLENIFSRFCIGK